MDESEKSWRGFVDSAIERWGDDVYRLALARTGSRQDAEDVFQEVFLSLFRRGRGFGSEDHCKAWLLRAACNRCNDVFRRRAARATRPFSPGEDFAEPPRGGGRADALDEAISALSDRQRAAVHLFYFEGYATEDVARITGERASTVRSHLRRARIAMRKALAAGGAGGPAEAAADERSAS